MALAQRQNLAPATDRFVAVLQEFAGPDGQPRNADHTEKRNISDRMEGKRCEKHPEE